MLKYMDQQSASLPPSQIDKNIVKLAQTLESVYGNPWGIIWRNFLAGFMRIFGMIVAYILLVAIIVFFVIKSGFTSQIQNVWKNITQGMIVDIQKNLQNSAPKIPSLNQNQIRP